MKKLLLLSAACFFACMSAFGGFTNVVNTETTIIASAEGNWGEVVENLRDDNKDTKFSCFFREDKAFIQYELTSPVVLYKYAIRTANDSPGRDPRSWTLLGSTNGSSWTPIDQHEDEFFSGRFFTNEYVVKGNTTAYQYYRLYITEIVGSDQLSFADWNLYVEDDSAIAPASLKFAGNALAEYANSVELGWKGGYYELYTSLKSGSYSFEGDDNIAGGTVSADGIYRIRVDYRTLPAEVFVQMIEIIDLWTPWNEFVIDELTYAGNSVFTLQNKLCNLDEWGDDRYRIRIFFENDVLETYGAWSSSSVNLTRTHNEKWGDNIDGLWEFNSHIPERYRNTGQPFNMEVNFNSNSVYTGTASDYIPAELPTSLSIQGTAVVEAVDQALIMKSDGVVFEIYTALRTGDYSFVGDDNINGTIAVSGESAPYRIRVNYASIDEPIITVEKVTSVYMWVPWSQHTAAYLTYKGNSIFKGENIICDTYNEWNSEHDNRFRIRMEFDYDEIETYAPKGDANFTLVGNDTWGGSDYNYSVDDRYYNNNVPFNVIVNLSVTSDYSFSFQDYEEVGIKKAKVDAKIYPTAISNDIEITLPTAGFDVEFISLTGATVLKSSSNSETLTLSGINMPKGIYIVKIVQDGHIVSTERIVKL